MKCMCDMISGVLLAPQIRLANLSDSYILRSLRRSLEAFFLLWATRLGAEKESLCR